MTIKPKKQELSKKVDLSLNNIINENSFFPQWEKIKELSLYRKSFFFKQSGLDINIWRKFSFKNNIEKYSIKTNNDKLLANLDLKVYKDSVYIINLDVKTFSFFNQIMMFLLQVAVEKALYNTTKKEVNINLLMPVLFKSMAKKVLVNTGFITQPEQSQYEKDMFGEAFSLIVDNSDIWQKKINQMPILINK